MSKKSTSKAFSRRSLFGPPPVLAGEDAAAYDELLGGVCAAIKPVDIIDEMFIADVVSLEWEVLRWRRLKWSLIRAGGLKALEDFLDKKLEYYLYGERFVDNLTQILQDNLAEDQAEDFARTLAQQCANNESDAVDTEGATDEMTTGGSRRTRGRNQGAAQHVISPACADSGRALVRRLFPRGRGALRAERCSSPGR
jgi:hypothetical protein